MKAVETAEVAAALRKIAGETQTLDWMTQDMHRVIDEAVIATSNQQMLSLLTEGVDPLHAGHATAQMVLVLAFNLGMATGRELEASNDFAAMMGGAFGASPSPDAGNPE